VSIPAGSGIDAVGVWQNREAAAEWDSAFAERLATRAEQQAILLGLLAETTHDGAAILDLGVGSGLVAEAVLEAMPGVSVVGVDFSEAMLELARERLVRFGARARLLHHDLAEIGTVALPESRYAAAFSVQTLHHLPDNEKEAAIAWSARAIEAGGLVVIVDQVSVSEPMFAAFAATWRRIDPHTPATYAEYAEALEREEDRPARLQDLLAWLEDADLDAACLHAYGNRAVLVGRKPAG
jgi:tRNA (cmo5U34)-methyltransferase